MTRTIKQFGDPWNPYGVQLWANDEEPVCLDSREIYRAGKPWLPDYEEHAALDWMVI